MRIDQRACLHSFTFALRYLKSLFCSMSDYTTAIAALIVVTVALSAAVVYILAQPTDLPVLKKAQSDN